MTSALKRFTHARRIAAFPAAMLLLAGPLAVASATSASGQELSASGWHTNLDPIDPGDVAISGTPTVGSELTAVTTGWDAEAVLTYEWFRDGAPIPVSTAERYAVTTADIGAEIIVKVTATKNGYLPAEKASTPVKGLGVITPGTVSVTGSPNPGKTLTAQTTTWLPSDVTLAYQWASNGIAIPNASSNTHIVTAEDLGKSITVSVTASKTDYVTSEPVTSRPLKAMKVEVAAATVSVTESTVTQGGSMTVTGARFAVGEEVELTFRAEPAVLATVKTGADGAFTAEVTVPAEMAVGSHILSATGKTSWLNDSEEITVTEEAVPPVTKPAGVLPVKPLAATGGEPVPYVLPAALLLLGAGAVMMPALRGGSTANRLKPGGHTK